MDMRHGTTPMGAVETQMIDVANAQVGKTLGVPTHAYMGLSDAPWPDYQGGSESTLGAALAILGGVNVISGPGMLKFESRQSLEKLIMDNDIIGTVRRLKSGIEEHECPIATHLMDSLLQQGHLLDHDHTRSWFRSEFYFPGKSFERRTDPGLESDAAGAHVRARKIVETILAKPVETYLDDQVINELRSRMSADLKRYGSELPDRLP
jgi:trimethylamine--corrinoid protein Co-methyltransferase